jgi:hypothetical protein
MHRERVARASDDLHLYIHVVLVRVGKRDQNLKQNRQGFLSEGSFFVMDAACFRSGQALGFHLGNEIEYLGRAIALPLDRIGSG